MIVALPLRRGVFVADAEIEGEFVASFKVVLQIAEVHALAQMSHSVIIDFVVAASAKEKVGQAIVLLLQTGQAASGARSAEVAGVIVHSIFGMEILHLRIDELVFEADF